MEYETHKKVIYGDDTAAPNIRCNTTSENLLSEVWTEGGLPIKLLIAKDLMAAHITGSVYAGFPYSSAHAAAEAMKDAEALLNAYNNS